MAISDYAESEVFSDLEKRVLDYAAALTRTPADASDELIAGLRAHLSDEQLVEITAMIAWGELPGAVQPGFDVAAQNFSEGACCPLPERPATAGE